MYNCRPQKNIQAHDSNPKPKCNHPQALAGRQDFPCSQRCSLVPSYYNTWYSAFECCFPFSVPFSLELKLTFNFSCFLSCSISPWPCRAWPGRGSMLAVHLGSLTLVCQMRTPKGEKSQPSFQRCAKLGSVSCLVQRASPCQDLKSLLGSRWASEGIRCCQWEARRQT